LGEITPPASPFKFPNDAVEGWHEVRAINAELR